jgi:glycine dehydrogenase subunit 1
MICELTGMEVANASMYDGGTALAEAVLMARRIVGGSKVLVPKSLNPLHRRILDTYAHGAGIEIVNLPFDREGKLVFEDVPKETIALVIQQPNGFGIIEDLAGLKERLGRAFLIVSVYPIPLGILEPPGSFGADIVVGEGQPLGNPLSFGGPLLGIFATRKEYVRMMPGRVSGRTVDAEGREGYVMTLQTREQHIRRERATSNICTNSALYALRATVYLAAVGPEGLRQVALLCLEKAHRLAEEITKIPGYEPAFEGPFFNEFAVRCPEPRDAFERLYKRGIAVTPPEYVEEMGLPGAFLVAVTEKRTEEEFEKFLDALKG